MRGAIGAGHPATAEAGAQVLADGGNAIDACVAAGFASWVAESPLSGPGGGGFMLVHRARDRSDALFDFFVAAPGIGAAGGHATALDEVDVAFEGGESSQRFRIGAASCAVPGTALGLETVQRAYGSLPWRVLAEPAIELARGGLEVTPAQGYLHTILDSILRRTGEGARVYGAGGRHYAAGDRLALPDLALTLEAIAEHGARDLYEGDLAATVVAHLQEAGSALTAEDLSAYRVVRRRPIRVRFRDHEFVSNPPPSSGGVLIGYGLRLVDRLGLPPSAGSAEEIALLAAVMGEQSRARGGSFDADLYRGGLAKRLLADDTVAAAAERLRGGTAPAAEPSPAGGTTHISVVDAEGNAASLSASLGSGSGTIVPGTGVHLNNMLGEDDLTPAGGSARPGVRLTSMMAPSTVLRDGRPRAVVGSAGSARLRGAILQVVRNVVDHGLPVDAAIDAPRVHVEGPELHCEGGFDPDELDRVEARGLAVVRWQGRNLYFGGVSAVELRDDGELAAAGDPRRGGHGVVVSVS